jgi:hypothetical protein
MSEAFANLGYRMYVLWDWLFGRGCVCNLYVWGWSASCYETVRGTVRSGVRKFWNRIRFGQYSWIRQAWLWVRYGCTCIRIGFNPDAKRKCSLCSKGCQGRLI